MRSFVSLALLSLSALALSAADTQTTDDEAAIRALVASNPMASQHRTADQVFWSGAYPRPMVGSVKADPLPGESDRKNQHASVEIQRLEIAASHDMAWEFSYGQIDFDKSDGTHVNFKNALLRVWKKVDGEWKQAALFVRPLDQPR